MHYFAIPPDIPAPLSDLDAIRRHYRTILGKNGGIVQIEAETVDAFPALYTLLELRQEPHDVLHVVAFTIPLRDCSFVIKAQCTEGAPTGLRETVVAAKLGFDTLAGWAADPYLARYARSSANCAAPRPSVR